MLVALFDPTRYRQGNFVPTASFENVRWHAMKDGRHSTYSRMYSTFWHGGSWPPTNQMIIRGLRNRGLEPFAREVSLDVLRYSIEQGMDGDVPLEKTDLSTINIYAEHFYTDFERKTKRSGEAVYRLGQSGVKNGHFVGWSGGPVVNGIIEELIGILPDAPKGRIDWRIHELPRHGLTNINLGPTTVGLIARARNAITDPVVVEVNTDGPFTLRATLGARTVERDFPAGQHTWEVGTVVDPLAGYTTTPADFSAQGAPIDPRWNIYGIRLGMTMDEVKTLVGTDRWFNKPMELFGHHYADRLSVYPEGKVFTNVLFNAEGRVIMVWTPSGVADQDPDIRRQELSQAFGEPVDEWRHPDFPASQYLVWGEANRDAYGLPDNGTTKPSLLMYNVGKGDVRQQNFGPRHCGLRLWDPVGIEKMRVGLKSVVSRAVTASQPVKQ